MVGRQDSHEAAADPLEQCQRGLFRERGLERLVKRLALTNQGSRA